MPTSLRILGSNALFRKSFYIVTLYVGIAISMHGHEDRLQVQGSYLEKDGVIK